MTQLIFTIRPDEVSIYKDSAIPLFILCACMARLFLVQM